MNSSETPIRVAQVMGKMLGGGVESVVMNYYRHIDRSRVQFDFLVDSDSTLVPREEIENLGGRVFEIPPYQHIFDYQRSLQDLFKQQKWQIVHSHINALSVFSLRAAKKAGVPVRIAHSHSTSGQGEFAKNTLKAILKTQANRYPTHRMACSQYAGEWLFGKDKSFDVLFNAIELDKFSFNQATRNEVRAELGLVGDIFVVGHVGRFMTQKNHKFLIDIFKEVSELRENSVLLLVGTGELRPFIESWVAERGLSKKVIFLGQRDDAYRIYQAFDAFVLPSLYEGLCLVGVEAQRAGLPCFFSDTITREVALSENVQFLSLESPAVWAGEILRAESGRFVDEGIFSDYDICQAAANLEQYYLSLLASSGKLASW